MLDDQPTENQQGSMPSIDKTSKTPVKQKMIIGILSAIILVLGYMFWTSYQNNQSLSKAKAAAVSSKDAIQKQLDDAKSQLSEVESKSKTSTTTKVATSKEDVAKAYAIQGSSAPVSSVNLTMAATQGNFVRFSVSFSGVPGGFALIVKNVGGVWIPVTSGQEAPGKEIGQRFGLPAGWYSLDY